ncbi:hypothetical protein ACJJTC_003774 [Scirpophaga incertulas]
MMGKASPLTAQNPFRIKLRRIPYRPHDVTRRQHCPTPRWSATGVADIEHHDVADTSWYTLKRPKTSAVSRRTKYSKFEVADPATPTSGTQRGRMEHLPACIQTRLWRTVSRSGPNGPMTANRTYDRFTSTSSIKYRDCNTTISLTYQILNTDTSSTSLGAVQQTPAASAAAGSRTGRAHLARQVRRAVIMPRA